MTSFAQFGNQLHSGERSYPIIKNRKRFLGTELGLMIISVILLLVMQLNPGIEFRGGTEFLIPQTNGQDQQPAYDAMQSLGASEGVRVSAVGEDSIRVQTQELDDAATVKAKSTLAEAYGVPEDTIGATFIGPTWGADVTNKAAWSLVIFLCAVAVVMAVYFRAWTMSLSALIALLHDVLVTVGFFALTQVEVSPATVIGLLTILGYSLYDTVVVFDKIRELTADFEQQRRYTYAELVNLAVNQTIVRSINTSVVALVPVGCILFIGSFLLGAGTLRDISLSLFVGMIAGTISSIFMAAPMLVSLRSRNNRNKDHTELVMRDRKKAAGEEGLEDDKILTPKVSPLLAGYHQGQAAQPRRKKRSDR